jgi:hypothetical protein
LSVLFFFLIWIPYFSFRHHPQSPTPPPQDIMDGSSGTGSGSGSGSGSNSGHSGGSGTTSGKTSTSGPLPILTWAHAAAAPRPPLPSTSSHRSALTANKDAAGSGAGSSTSGTGSGAGSGVGGSVGAAPSRRRLAQGSGGSRGGSQPASPPLATSPAALEPLLAHLEHAAGKALAAAASPPGSGLVSSRRRESSSGGVGPASVFDQWLADLDPDSAATPSSLATAANPLVSVARKLSIGTAARSRGSSHGGQGPNSLDTWLSDLDHAGAVTATTAAASISPPCAGISSGSSPSHGGPEVFNLHVQRVASPPRRPASVLGTAAAASPPPSVSIRGSGPATPLAVAAPAPSGGRSAAGSPALSSLPATVAATTTTYVEFCLPMFFLFFFFFTG